MFYNRHLLAKSLGLLKRRQTSSRIPCNTRHMMHLADAYIATWDRFKVELGFCLCFEQIALALGRPVNVQSHLATR